MESWTDNRTELEGNVIAILLDKEEYPSKVGNVAAISDRQILYLKRDRHELVNFRYEFFDMDDCKAIEYKDEMVYYRVVIAVLSILLTVILLFMLVTGLDWGSKDVTPFIIGPIASMTFFVRFSTSTHRHVLKFEMPDQILSWRSPAIDYKSKAAAAQAVREFARERGILRENAS